MPYIGRELESGNYLKLDDISSSFNGSTTTFNLTAGGKAFFPGSAFSILVNLAGVVQEPEAAYQINNSQITFATAPASGNPFFCIVLGVAHGINVPGNGTVDGAKLAGGFNYDGYFYLDDTNNRVGIGTANPAKPLDVAGEGQFGSVRVLGDLTVDGTTTTLDTVVTEVDRLEIGANNTTVGAAITQTGSGDILRLYDGASQVVTVEDDGNFVVGGTSSGGWKSKIQVANNASYQSALNVTNGVNADFNVDIKTNETRIGTSPSVPLVFKTNNTERLRITSNGNFGVGTDDPQRKLVVSDAGTEGLEFFPGDSVNGSTINAYNRTTSSFTPFSLNALDYRFSPNGATEAVRITSAGNVGIGLTNPSAKLSVTGNLLVSSDSFTGVNAGIFFSGWNDYSAGVYARNSGDDLVLQSGGSERLRLTSTGKITQTNFSGIGLHMTGSGDPTLQISDADGTNQHVMLSHNGGDSYIVTRNNTSHGGFRVYSQDGSSTLTRLRIDSAGNVSLGTPSPNSYTNYTTLTINGTNGGEIDLEANGTLIGDIFATTSGMYLTTRTSTPILFRTNGSNERLRIHSTGWQQSHAGYATVGINTFASWARTGGAIRAEVGYNAVTTDYMYFGTGTTHPLALRTGNTNALYIDTNQKVGIGTDAPSDKLSIYAAPNSLILGAKDSTRGNHVFQLLADDSNGNGELRLYQNSASGTHEKTVQIQSSGDSYFTGGRVGINKSSPSSEAQLDVLGSSYWPILVKTSSSGGGGVAIKNKDDVTSLYVGSAGSAWLTGSAITDGLIRAQNDLIFASNANNERLRIASDGDLEYKYNDADTATEVGATQVPHGLRINNTNNTLGRLAGISFSHGGGGTANAGIFHETTNTTTASTGGLGDLTFWTKPTGASHMVERLRLTSEGNLLLEKNNNAYLNPEFEIYNSYNGGYGGSIRFTGKMSGSKYEQAKIRVFGGSNTSDGSLAVHTGDGNEKFRIDSSGNVGIGTNVITNLRRLQVHADNSVIRISSRGATSGDYAQLEFKTGTQDAAWIWQNPPQQNSHGGPGSLAFYQSTSGAGYRFYTLGSNTRFEIDASGNVTKPNNPAFGVWKNITNWNIAADTIFDFDSAQVNRGSHYNTSNYRFTAPVSGIYQINFHTIIYTTNQSNASIVMKVNGSGVSPGGYIHWSSTFGSARWHNISYSRVIYLTANDYLEMWNGAVAANYHGGAWCYWSGYLAG